MLLQARPGLQTLVCTRHRTLPAATAGQRPLRQLLAVQLGLRCCRQAVLLNVLVYLLQQVMNSKLRVSWLCGSSGSGERLCWF